MLNDESLKECLYAYLRTTVGLITDYLDKVSIAEKQVISFLLVDSLAFNLLKKEKATF